MALLPRKLEIVPWANDVTHRSIHVGHPIFVSQTRVQARNVLREHASDTCRDRPIGSAPMDLLERQIVVLSQLVEEFS